MSPSEKVVCRLGTWSGYYILRKYSNKTTPLQGYAWERSGGVKSDSVLTFRRTSGPGPGIWTGPGLVAMDRSGKWSFRLHCSSRAFFARNLLNGL